MPLKPDAGAIGSRLENLDGSIHVSRFRDYSPMSELLHVAATGPLTRLPKRYNVSIEVEDETTPAGWLSFACILVPNKVIREIGLLDEDFFMYFGMLITVGVFDIAEGKRFTNLELESYICGRYHPAY